MYSSFFTLLLVSSFAVTRAQVTGQQILFDGTVSGCVTVGSEDTAAVSGDVVHISDCIDPSTSPISQLWSLTRSQDDQIILSSTLGTDSQLCLDAGTDFESNGSEVTVLDCQVGGDGSAEEESKPVAQQWWYYTTDDHIAIYEGTRCLDVIADPQADESGETVDALQTWACSGPDEQQIFQVDDGLSDFTYVVEGTQDIAAADLPYC